MGHATRNELRELSRWIADWPPSDTATVRPGQPSRRPISTAEAAPAPGPAVGPTIPHRSREQSGGMAGIPWCSSDSGDLLSPTASGFAGLRASDHARLYLFGRAHARLSERSCRKLFDELCAGLPEAVETLLSEKTAA